MSRNIKKTFEEKVLTTLRHYGMLNPGDKLLCAVSGGKDSVALITFLLNTSGLLKVTFAAVHLNHSLRGAESDGDEAFVRDFCEKNNIELFCEKLDITTLARVQKLSIETAAREARYRLFDKIVKENKIDKIVTAHTASDNTETVLMNLMRGSGTDGLCGIPPIRDNIIRPLINVTSDEVVSYLNAQNISFRTDSSNFSTDYTRNLFRLELIPRFKEKNPSFDDAVSRMSYTLSCDKTLIAKISKEKAKELGVDFEKRTIPIIKLRDFAKDKSNTSIIYNILTKLACEKNDEFISFERFMAIIDALEKTDQKIIIELGNSKAVKLDGKTLNIINSTAPKSQNDNYDKPLNLGLNYIDEINTEILIEKARCVDNFKNINKKNKNIYLDFDRIKGNLFVRNKADGDKIILNQMTKTLKKLFNGIEISSEEVLYYPVIYDNIGIVAIAGVCVSDRVRVTKDSNVFCITILKSPLLVENGVEYDRK